MRASSAWPAEGRGLRLLRAALPAALVAQALLLPLLLGAVQPAVYGPFVALALLAGLASWGLAHWDRAHGREVPKVPGRGLLLAFHALVAFQLVPLPPALLRLLSPGSFAFHDERLLLGLRAWEPVSVSPSDTLRGLLFLLAQTQVYALAFRELGREAWRRRLAGAVVAAGVASAGGSTGAGGTCTVSSSASGSDATTSSEASTVVSGAGGASETVGSSSSSSSSSRSSGGGTGVTAARGGMRHWIITTPSVPGMPSQRMSPLRRAAWPVTLSSLTNSPSGALVS